MVILNFFYHTREILDRQVSYWDTFPVHQDSSSLDSLSISLPHSLDCRTIYQEQVNSTVV